MRLVDHLIELRKRLLIAAIAIALGLVIGWLLSEWVWDVLRVPIDDLGALIQHTDVTSGFDTRVQISLFIAILVSSPVWLYQVWAFIVPGLKKREKWYAVGFLAAAMPLFLTGIYVGWTVLPNIVRLMAIFQAEEDAFQITARSYVDLAVKLLLAVGVGFVMPVLLVLLNFIGVVRGRTIIKSWRGAILIIVLFAAITTPAADIMTMFILAVPLTVLYFIAAGIALWHDRVADKRLAREMADLGIDSADDGTGGDR